VRRSTTRRTHGLAATALAVIAARAQAAVHERIRAVDHYRDTHTNTDTGEFVADVDFRVAGPHPALELEPCDIATQLIG